MRSIKKWFSLGEYDEDDGRKRYWWNGCYDFSGTRIRFMAGDLLASCENDNGGYRGAQFEVGLHLMQEDIPEFYLPDNPRAEYDIHTFTTIFWRWGVYLSIRGRVKREVPDAPDWGLSEIEKREPR